jgi:hypothetical protein
MSPSDDFIVEYQIEDDMIVIPHLLKFGCKKWIRLPGKYFQTDAVELAKILGENTKVRAFFVNHIDGAELPINNLATMDYL